MKATMKIAGNVLLLMGVVWILQGVGILPGSFMSGQIRWAYYGGAAALVGIGLLAAASRPV